MSRDRADELEREIARLERDLARLDRQWEQLPKLLPGVLLAIPAGLLCGVAAGFVASALYVGLLGSLLYRIGAQRSRHARRLDACRRDLLRVSPRAPA